MKTEKSVRAPRSKISKPNKKNTAPRLHNKTFFKVAGTYWRSDGDGWELRKSGGANDPNKDDYLGRLSGKAYAEMKSKFQGEALAQALYEWAITKAAKKGIKL